MYLSDRPKEAISYASKQKFHLQMCFKFHVMIFSCQPLYDNIPNWITMDQNESILTTNLKIFFWRLLFVDINQITRLLAKPSALKHSRLHSWLVRSENKNEKSRTSLARWFCTRWQPGSSTFESLNVICGMWVDLALSSNFETSLKSNGES